MFNTEDARPTIERVSSGTDLVNRYAVSVANYLQTRMEKGIGVPGQPDLQHYFHRPLSVLLAAAFRNGLVMDGIEEPRFSSPPNPDRPLSWLSYPDIPPVFVARMRVR